MMDKLWKKGLYFLVLLSLLLCFGCMDNKTEDKAVGLKITRNGSSVECSAEDVIEAAQVKVSGAIEISNIQINKENMGFVYEKGDGIYVSVVGIEGKMDKLFDIIGVEDKVEVVLMDKITDLNEKKLNIKKTDEKKLLGDFNLDDVVGLADFNLMKQNYMGSDITYDIGPASLGEGDWSEIYCYSNKDGKVDLWDLSVIIRNYGKKKPNTQVITPQEIIVSGIKDMKLGDSIILSAKIKYSDGSQLEESVNWVISQNGNSVEEEGNKYTFEAEQVGIVNVEVKYLTLSKTYNFNVSDNIEEGIKIYIESDTAPGLYAWVGTAPSETKLLGAWPGKTLTETEGGFYYYDFGTEYESINYINFINGQSADLVTDKTVWVLKDGTIVEANPYEPSKPVININKKGGSLNGETAVCIDITAVNNTVDEVEITFDGKSVSYANGKAEFKLSDFIEDKETGTLYIMASNSKGTTSMSAEFVREDEVSEDEVSGLKLYLENNTTVYAWIVENGVTKNLNGGWPGQALTETETSAGVTWYVLDFGDVEGGNYILDAQGGADQSISSSTWIDKNGSKYTEDPYLPTKPLITINPGSGTYNDSKDRREIKISVTARNTSVDSKNATIKIDGGSAKTLTLSGEESIFDLSDNIPDKSTAIITVTASNDMGTTEKSVTITRDDEYKVPKAEFTWDNAMVYFVLTDRFYNGNPSNDNSYGRQNGFSPDPLDIATFHGGDVAGLTEKIEDGYFDELGVNVIWVTALYEQIHGWVGGGSGDFPHYAYHGYYALDWTMADKNMGTIDEIREFVNTAHEHEIRVVMDVVVNHAGYNSVMDMHDYGFASYDTSVIDNRDWMHPMTASGWQSHHETLVYYKDEQRSAGTSPTPITDWLNWWGPDWVRTGIDGYDSGDGSELENPLCGLPDIKTETTTAVDMAPIMKTKWGMETSGDEDWIVPAASEYRNPNAKIAPADHIIHSLAAWVEEFGIDGFRCDTAKHIELTRWKQLKEEANAALKNWRSNNPNAYGADWDEDFWMVGEWWDFKLGGDNGVYDNGFDAMIDFGFPVKNGSGDLGGTWQSYAGAVNKVMPYLNSHDMGKVGFFGKGANCIPAGTALVLNPGPIQLFYGDENDRPKGPSCTDPDHSIRSDYVWGANQDKLAHWQKLGKFRNMNPAVGAGTQTDIGNDTYLREWEDNKVVIKINATGSTDVEVAEVWTDGTLLRNAYNGETAVVTDGMVNFTAENNVILIEESR